MAGGAEGKIMPLRAAKPCPECGKPSTRENYPFCSPRCKAVDLNRWLSGAYAIPVTEDDDNKDVDEQR
ncbi:MAG: DNA gyrase inhibitor YacG [Rhizobiaceae bacterium]